LHYLHKICATLVVDYLYPGFFFWDIFGGDTGYADSNACAGY
jgi:hypothetical protein